MSNKCGGGSLAIKLLAKRCICMIYRREQLNWLKILFLQFSAGRGSKNTIAGSVEKYRSGSGRLRETHIQTLSHAMRHMSYPHQTDKGRAKTLSEIVLEEKPTLVPMVTSNGSLLID